MRGFRLALPSNRPPTLLFIGAHCDDIEIGCGATAIQLLRQYPKAPVHWLVLSSGARRAKEARAGARAILRGRPNADVRIQDFRESYFPSEFAAIKDYLEQLKRDVEPDLVFTHSREELHQDHRIVGELTWNTFRNHTILEYEIAKYDGGLGSPSVFVPLTRAAATRKVKLLMSTFRSQHGRDWFTPETFWALMRLRGIECHAPSGYAEAFYSRKLVLDT